MVKEGEDEKKKSWFFGRKKQSSDAGSGYVSRPPSAASFPRRTSVIQDNKGRKTSPSEADGDDDLPPRMDPMSNGEIGATAITSSPTSTPTTTTATTGVDAEAEPKERESLDSQLPARAGFNFAAIKQMIGDSKEEASVKAPAKNGVAVSHRSVSMPVRTVPEEEGESSKTKLGDRLSSLFRRPSSSSSLSLATTATAAVEEEEEDFGGFESATVTPSTTSVSVASKMMMSTPNLTFTDSTGSVWGKEHEDVATSSFSVASPLASASTSNLTTKIPPPPLGRSSAPTLDTLERPSSSPPVSYGIPSASAFSAGSHFSPPSLSFGGADGSITAGPGSGSGGEPWSAPLSLGYGHGLYAKKRAASSVSTGFDSNPWS